MNQMHAIITTANAAYGTGWMGHHSMRMSRRYATNLPNQQEPAAPPAQGELATDVVTSTTKEDRDLLPSGRCISPRTTMSRAMSACCQLRQPGLILRPLARSLGRCLCVPDTTCGGLLPSLAGSRITCDEWMLPPKRTLQTGPPEMAGLVLDASARSYENQPHPKLTQSVLTATALCNIPC
jgi:hypothetical protein